LLNFLSFTRAGLMNLRAIAYAACLIWMASVRLAGAQEPMPVAEEMIQLNFPTEIEVKTLADYVSDRLKISIFYDDSIRGKRITVRAAQPIPASSLLGVLQSALKMKGLLMVDAETPGWYRIVASTRLTDLSRMGVDAEGISGVPVTETFFLKHLDVQRMDGIIKQFLTQPGANSIAVSESHLLIVTDFAENLLKIRDLIRAMDQADAQVLTDFYSVKNLTASAVMQSVNPILNATPSRSGPPVQMLVEARTNQVAIIGTEADVTRAKELLQRFDIPLGLQTAVYQMQSLPVERIDKLFQELIDPVQKETLYRSTIDPDVNLLIVHTTPELHRRFDELRQQLDVAPKKERSPVRFVKLNHANVNDVLQTLRSIGDVGGAGGGMDRNTGLNSPNSTPLDAGGIFGMNTPLAWSMPLVPSDSDDSPSWRGPMGYPQLSGGGAQLPGGVRVSADPLTNSLVLVGDPNAQQAYLELIERLDIRRPQVMIEAHIIAIDTSDNFKLGIEVSLGDRSGTKRLFEFTSFGLSEVDPLTGALRIIPNIGFNGTLVDPDVADVVVQALAGHNRARVLASPKILVNDNTRGRFESVLSVPFQSVNASQTVSTTSLGGNQQAGTTIDVTPHIKQGNELELEFDVEFSSFSGNSAGAALPPPRQISRAESIVTIPDAQTVIVGGLKQIGESESFTGVPYLELVPVLRELTSLQSTNRTTTSFFLFFKPVIVRDDQFAALKCLSSQAGREADFSTRFPASQPILMRDAHDCRK